MNAESLGKIEHEDPNKRRRMDVDDLVALAWVLETTPNRILLTAKTDSSNVDLTPNLSATAERAWEWASERPDWGSQEFSPELFPLWPKLREAHAILRRVVEESGHSWRAVVEAMELAGKYAVVHGEFDT